MSRLDAAVDRHPLPRPPTVATVGEAADYCRLSVRTLRRAIASKALPVQRVGARVLISYEALDRFLGVDAQDRPAAVNGPTAKAADDTTATEVP